MAARRISPSKWVFNYREEIQISRATRQGFGLVLFDIDTFTAFNQQSGHVAGDCLIAALAKRMQDMLQPDDFVARYAGEEFALIIRRAWPQAVAEAAGAVREAVAGAEFSLGQLLRPDARYSAAETQLPASAANEEFRRGLRCLKADELAEAGEAFRAALERDANHVPSIMELAFLELRKTLDAARLDEVFRVTLSGGVGWYQEGDTPEALIERADQGLGRAKQGGRNQVQVEA